MERWEHQIRAVEAVHDAVSRGEVRICLTSPTGGGKTVIACDLIRDWLAADLKVVLYTNRKLLVEQTSRVLKEAGLSHGVRASGHDEELGENLQISSVQTEAARVLRGCKWPLHAADRVLVDEAHMLKGVAAKKLFERHWQAGAVRVGLTATPLGIGDLYDCLIVAGTTSELRNCGALVRCDHYGPDEPDMKALGRITTGDDLTEKQLRKAFPQTEALFGRVLEWFEKLNPEHKPTILFAGGVPESLWFAEQFHRAGVSSAHIDGETVWVDGKLYRSSKEERADVLEGSKNGRIRVICNRFVLREGVDAPWLAHGIFATIFGSLQSYLQSGGRLLRSFPGMGSVTLQDHGGNWWRHGSLNADREWNLEWDSGIVSGLREHRLRSKAESEPYRCPECGRILSIRCCPCGFEAGIGRRSRPVVQSDGTLKAMKGDIFRPHRISQRPDGPALWKRMYFRSLTKKGTRTFRAAAALFAQENHWGWPSPEWPLMPVEPMDWFRLVGDVPKERLIQEAVRA